MSLPKFEGAEVAATKIKITNAGDGLSAAMEIDPVVLKQRSTVYVVLECEVGRIAFDPAKEGRSVVRVQTLKAGVATLVDKPLVAEVLEAQRVALEQAAGVNRLDFDGPGLEPVPDPDGGWEDGPDAAEGE